MPKAYLVAHIRVHDAQTFETFKTASGPVIREYGGRVLARNPSPEYREGDLRGETVLIEFDDMDSARRFYDSQEYTDAKLIRQKSADTDLMLVEGL